MFEKSIARQQAGRVRRAKNEPSEPRDLAGACSGGKFVVSRSREAYDAQARGPNRKLRVNILRTRMQRILPAAMVDSYLMSLPKRGGIILAFNRKMLVRHRIAFGEETDGGCNEIVFDIPSGKLELDALAGFEPLGEFEDALLKSIGVTR